MPHIYVCKHCGRPVERTIEGELVCADCYSQLELTEEQRRERAEMQYYLTHCQECDRPLPGGGLCKACEHALDSYWD